MNSDYRPMKGTQIPRLDLIPRDALLALVARFEKGIESFGDKAWNASLDRERFEIGATDQGFVEARLCHVIDHASKALAKIRGHIEDDSDDDAGAILFGGALLAVYCRIQKEQASGPFGMEYARGYGAAIEVVRAALKDFPVMGLDSGIAAEVHRLIAEKQQRG